MLVFAIVCVIGFAVFCSTMSVVGCLSYIKHHDWHYLAGMILYFVGALACFGWLYSMS